MISGQRRVHRAFWLVAAPLLLAGAVALFLARPDDAPTSAAAAPASGGRP